MPLTLFYLPVSSKYHVALNIIEKTGSKVVAITQHYKLDFEVLDETC